MAFQELTKNLNRFKILPALSIFMAMSLSNCSINDTPRYEYKRQQYAPAPMPPRPNYYAPKPVYTNSPYNYQQPESRSYSNPYALPPQNQYPYYDGDQYYVPPTYYGIPNTDNAPNSSFDQKY